MNFLRRLEEAAAKKLKKALLGAQQYAQSTIEDLDRAEKELQLSKERAAEATARAHTAAVEVAENAQSVANQLLVESRVAKEKADTYAKILEESKPPK